MINISMKVLDLIEAINLGQHGEEIEQLIKKGLIAAIGQLSTLKDSEWLKKAEKSVARGEFREMGEQLRPQLKSAIEGSMAYTLKSGLGRQFNIQYVGFDDTGTSGAYVQAQNIVISSRWSEIVSRALIQSLFDTISNNYSEEEFVGAVYFVPKLIMSGDRNFVSAVIDTNKKVQHQTANLANLLVHELVHVVQNSRQSHRNVPPEYRSYLDKSKGEFSGVHHKRMSGEISEPNPDQAAEERYWNLYLASPQEITAFAHQIALKIINDSGVKDAKTVDELNRAAQQVDADWIVSAISDELHGRFRNPASKKEVPVFKRYMKLTYTEFAQTVNSLRAKLTQQAQQSQDNQF